MAEAETFGVEWVKKWIILRDRLVEIAKVWRRFPWMVEVRQRPVGILHPYTVEMYVAVDRRHVFRSPRRTPFAPETEP